jgi:AraC-like DNA-binding protein
MTNEHHFFLKKISHWLQADLSEVVFSQPVPAHDDPLRDPQKLVFIESGTPLITIGRAGKIENLPLPSGTVLLGAHGANTGLLSVGPSPAQTLAICFFADYIRLVEYQFNADNGPNNIRFLHTPYSLQFGGKTLLELLDYSQRNPVMKSTVPHLIKALLSLLSTLLEDSDAGKERSKSTFTWRQIEAYVKNHLNGDLSREKLAKISKLNPNYLSMLCRKKTGITLNEYVRKQRLMQAAIMLEFELTLDEIASACGFQSASYFIRLFKAEYGTSPGKYRCQHHNPSFNNEPHEKARKFSCGSL